MTKNRKTKKKIKNLSYFLQTLGTCWYLWSGEMPLVTTALVVVVAPVAVVRLFFLNFFPRTKNRQARSKPRIHSAINPKIIRLRVDQPRREKANQNEHRVKKGAWSDGALLSLQVEWQRPTERSVYHWGVCFISLVVRIELWGKRATNVAEVAFLKVVSLVLWSWSRPGFDVNWKVSWWSNFAQWPCYWHFLCCELLLISFVVSS